MRQISKKLWIRALGGSLVVLSASAWADAGYQDTSQITGGSLVQMLRSIPFMPKSAKHVLDPMVTSVALHGNQLARTSKASTEIIDLDRETITRIDNDKKSYTVMTFEEMRQSFRDASKKVADDKTSADEPASDATPQKPQYKVTFDVSVTTTGASRSIDGVLAKEQILTMKAHVTPVDPPPADQPQSSTFSLITDVWNAPEPAEMHAIDEFYVRYGKKLMQGVDTTALIRSLQPGMNPAGMTTLFASQPGMAGAMPEMLKKIADETAKIKGVSLLAITRVGGENMVAPSADVTAASVTASESGSPVSNAGSTVAKEVATDTTTAAVQQQVNKLGAIGSAFGSSVMSAFHRSHSADASAVPSDEKGAQPAAETAVLFETTTRKQSFSADPVAPALFQVPVGYTMVEAPHSN